MVCGGTWADPFADASADDSSAGGKEYVHVRVQQRNGRKSLTTVQGLKKQYSYSKILKDLKKEFCCNGTVVQDPELGQVCSEHLVHWTDSIRIYKCCQQFDSEKQFFCSRPLKLYLNVMNFPCAFLGRMVLGS